MKLVTREELKRVLRYNKRTGLFTWKVNIFRRKHKGRIAGCKLIYVVISVNRKTYYAHRLAWLYVTGQWPKQQIDHKNRNKHDNRFTNLRLATSAQNRQNRILHDWQGVIWDKSRNKWMARIQINRKSINIGRYKTKMEALVARRAVARMHEFFPR